MAVNRTKWQAIRLDGKSLKSQSLRFLSSYLNPSTDSQPKLKQFKRNRYSDSSEHEIEFGANKIELNIPSDHGEQFHAYGNIQRLIEFARIFAVPLARSFSHIAQCSLKVN